METTTINFKASIHYGIPVAWLDTELATTDIYGTPVVIDEFWHNGSVGIMASGFKFRKDGKRMNRRFQQMRVVPTQEIRDALNALQASLENK